MPDVEFVSALIDGNATDVVVVADPLPLAWCLDVEARVATDEEPFSNVETETLTDAVTEAVADTVAHESVATDHQRNSYRR